MGASREARIEHTNQHNHELVFEEILGTPNGLRFLLKKKKFALWHECIYIKAPA